ncbi:MAG: thioredoxin domain-containing protein [Parvularculaceae bacterium]
MRFRRFVIPVLAIVGVAALALATRAPAESAEPYTGKPEIVAATFSSAWCSSCKILEPRLKKVIPQFAGDPIKFVDLDFTFGDRAAVKETAEEAGISEVYERSKGATGFTMLVDRDTGEVIDILTINYSEKAMKAAISRALAIASHTDDPAAAAPLAVEKS